MAHITKELMQEAEAAVAALGIEHFILLTGMDEKKALGASFHEMKSSETINVLISSLVSAIDRELALNPTYKKSYADIFRAFKAKFISLVKHVNKAIAKYQQEEK